MENTELLETYGTEKLIGRNIKKLREGSGFTMAETAAAIRVAPGHLSLAEGGDYDLGIVKMMHLADFFDVSLDVICDMATVPIKEEVPNDSFISSLSMISKLLSNDDKTIIFAVAMHLSKSNNVVS